MKEQPPIRVHLASLGCAKNLVDSERILGRLAAAGAVVGAPPEEADVILVNTCGFIAPAKEESIETILHLARFKETGRCTRLIVMGCLAHRYGDELRDSLPEVDGVFALGEGDAIVRACGLHGSRHRRSGRFLLTPRHTAYLRIADGCDNRCAYCAIPVIRGPFRSRPAAAILREAEQLVASGVRELNLIGQDTTRYGTDLKNGPRIHELIPRLAEIRRLKWLRLLYTHPAHFTDDLIRAYAATPRLCPYVDLPLQHLNDVILKRMGRNVTQSEILDLIDRIRAGIPGVAIRTAFIVGFPGETRAQFNELLALVKKLRFEHLGAFAYSREEDTRAARMRSHVSERAKARRLRDLMLAQQHIAFQRNRSMTGKVLEVLIDEPCGTPALGYAESPAEGGQATQSHVAHPPSGVQNPQPRAAGPHTDATWVARSPAQAPDVDSVTYVRADSLRPGQFLKARITATRGYDLLARPARTARDVRRM